MSSFPNHERNIRRLEDMGFAVSEAIEDGEVTFESWHYDALVDLMEEVISVLEKQKFKVGENDELHIHRENTQHTRS